MRVLLWFTLLALSVPFHSLRAQEKPNFIVIFCDDLGYADIGCFGSKNHRTPNIDRLATEGRKFTSFYSTSGVCSPSRASLMTGCYPKRVGLHQNESGQWVLFPGNRKGLNPSEITVAEVLKEAGYATACVGKWHLGDQAEFLPTRQGFDSYYGIPFSNDMGQTDRPDKRYPPLPFLENEAILEEEPDQRYLTKRYTEKALEFIESHQNEPFFLYLPHTMPHWPQYSSPNFEGKSANGAWGDTVEEIDWSTGEILKQLKKLGLDEKTLVLFTSDNGGATRHGASNTPLSGAKGSTLEGGQRICMAVRWPGKIPAGTVCDEISSTMDILPTFAALSGGSVPSDRKIDGHDISGLLTGDAKSPYESFYYYFRGELQAVRSGKWKLHLPRKVRKGKKATNVSASKLYDLEADIGEQSDLLSSHPEVVARLEKHVEMARNELGDDFTGAKGAGIRAPGMVKIGKTLTEQKE